jgi:hypothetical protein
MTNVIVVATIIYVSQLVMPFDGKGIGRRRRRRDAVALFAFCCCFV